MSKRIIALVVSILGLVQTEVVGEHHEEAIDLGTRLELFVDHFLLERLVGARLRMHHRPY